MCCHIQRANIEYTPELLIYQIRRWCMIKECCLKYGSFRHYI